MADDASYQKIKAFLADIPHEDFEHEPVFTSEQAEAVRPDLTMRNGMKSILVKYDGNFTLLVVTADSKLSNSKVRKLLGVKDFRFASPEDVVEKMGCEIGACYPFGNLIDIDMFVDRIVSQNEWVATNPGVHNRTIKLRWTDYENKVRPKIADIAREPDGAN